MRNFLFFFLSALSVSTFAQSLNGHFLSFGFNYAFETVKDDALSSVSYSGSLGGLQTGYSYQDDHWISTLDITGSGGFQRPDVSPEKINRETLSIIARGTYQLSYKVYTKNDWSFFTGILSHNLWDYRNHNRYSNNSDNFTGLFSLGPAFTVQKPFELWSQDFALQYNLGLPFGTYYLRPGYIKPYFNESIGNKGFAFWGDFYAIDSRTDLIWIFKNGNQLRLSYNWEYEQLNDVNLVQLGAQRISLSTYFKF